MTGFLDVLRARISAHPPAYVPRGRRRSFFARVAGQAMAGALDTALAEIDHVHA
jgi:hypothetical protein